MCDDIAKLPDITMLDAYIVLNITCSDEWSARMCPEMVLSLMRARIDPKA